MDVLAARSDRFLKRVGRTPSINRISLNNKRKGFPELDRKKKNTDNEEYEVTLVGKKSTIFFPSYREGGEK